MKTDHKLMSYQLNRRCITCGNGISSDHPLDVVLCYSCHMRARLNSVEFGKELDEKIQKDAVKFDQDKNRLDLLSPIWVMGVGQVLTYGAKKYSDNNWREGNGLKVTRLLGACLRHVFAFMGGENVDPETGMSHLYHASCCLMFASELYLTKGKTCDDRWTTELKETKVEHQNV